MRPMIDRVYTDPPRYGRLWAITMMRSGHLYIHKRGTESESGSLPVFSTRTKTEARTMVASVANLDRDGLYRVPDLTGSLDDIDTVASAMERLEYLAKLEEA